MTACVQMKGLCVQAGRRPLLRDISFDLAGGAFLALVGPNGAGKSTLLRALLRLLPFRGSLRLLGEEIACLTYPALARLRRRIAYVPQMTARQEGSLPLSAHEVVALGRVCRSRPGRRLTVADRKLVDEALAGLGLAKLAGRPFPMLSGGEQRKVHLARALVQQPEILLLDEPTGHLDFSAQEEITNLIGRCWRERGWTVLMATHDLRHLPPGIDRVATLHQGRLVDYGAPHNILTAQRLSALYERPMRVRVEEGRYQAWSDA